MTTRSLQQSKTPSNNPTPTGKNQPQLRVTSPQDKKSSTISKSSNAQFREPSSSPLERSPQYPSSEEIYDNERSAEPRKSTQKSISKATPIDNKATSAAKNQSSAKENEISTPRTLPIEKATREKEREGSFSKDSTSKKGQTSIQKPQSNQKVDSKQQQLFLDPRNPGKVGIRSADKDISDKTNSMSADRNLRTRADGKLSSRSENVLYGKNKEFDQSPIIEDFQEYEVSKGTMSSSELKKNLTRILDDQDTKVQITARTLQQTDVIVKSRGTSTKKEKTQQKRSETKSSRGKRSTMQQEEQDDIENIEVKVEEVGENGGDNRLEMNEEEAPVDRSGETTGNVARKEYSLYEDWRILEAMRNLIEKDGLKTMSSRAMWNKIEDPLTGRRLLDGKRTSESMRDRFKRYLSNIDEVGRETISDFAEDHTPEEMQKYYSVFKKVEGVKQFTGISDQLNYNPEKIQRKTPYGTKSTKQLEKEAGKVAEKPYKRKGEGRLEESFEEEEKDDIIGQHMNAEWNGDEDLHEFNEFERQMAIPRDSELAMMRSRETSKQKPISMSSTTKGGKTVTDFSNNFPVQTSRQTRAPQRVFYEEEKMPLENQPERADFQMIEDPRYKNKRKASEYDNTGSLQGSQKEMKRVRMEGDYDHRSLQLTAMFGNRKVAEPRVTEGGIEEESLMIYVDLSRGFRQFVKLDPEEERRRQENAKLSRLAELYHTPLNEVVAAFRKVSFDYVDLEEYLQARDPKILWTEEEDSDLMDNNPVAMKYLKLIKGDEKIRKRRAYLSRIL